MKWLDKLEARFGRYAIRNLMLYVVLAKAAVFLLCLFNMSWVLYLTLEPSLVRSGQVWRVVTFLMLPPSISVSDFFIVAINLYFDYFVGRLLENRWGAFKLNVYYFFGAIVVVAVSMIFGVSGTAYYLEESLFLAFATLYPDVQVLLFFILPIKVKWMGYAFAALLLYQFITGGVGVKLMIAAGLVNYFIFFGPELINIIRYKIHREDYQRKAGGGSAFRGFGSKPVYKRVGEEGKVIRDVAFHRCTICGKTERDDPHMQFRYCAQCSGNREYCMDHLYDHTHYIDPNDNG